MKLVNIKFICACLATFFWVSCGQNPSSFDPRDTVQVPEGHTGEDSIAYIENAVVQSPISCNDLLGLAEVHSVEGWLFNYNNFEQAKVAPEHASQYLATRRDSCAMRLANRVMRMHEVALLNGDAMDQLQFARAVNVVLDSFKSEIPNVAPDSALFEIERLTDKFSSQTQLELNVQSSLLTLVEFYRTIEAYRQWLSEVPSNLKSLAQEEYKTWYALNQARFSLWRDVSYLQERYSMKPMEIEAYYSNMMQNRRAELAIERSIVLVGEEYKQKGRTVNTQQWEDWIAKSSVPEDIDLLKELDMEECIPSQETVTERVDNLRNTFSKWLAARQALAAALPEVRSTSYDNLTADIHCRMIGKLPPLVPLDF